MSEIDRPVSLPDSDVESGRSWWLLPNLHDGLGERFLSFDEDGAMVEMLRIREDLISHPAFADALRQRLLDLAGLSSDWVASMREGESPQPGSLELLAEHCGTRLGEVRTDDVATALAVMEQVLYATSILHGVRSDVAHGAIDVARVGLTSDGHVRLLEPVFGSALATLEPDGRLRGELSAGGVAAGPIDQAADVVLCAFMGLSLLQGEPVTPAQAADLDTLVNTAAAACSPQVVAWLRRAVRASDEPWPGAREALAALQPLLAGTPQSRAALVASLATRGDERDTPAEGVAVGLVGTDRTGEPAAPPLEQAAQPPAADGIAPGDHVPVPTSPPAVAPPQDTEKPEAPPAAVPRAARRADPAATAPPRSSRASLLLVPAVVLLAIVVTAQAVYIVRNTATTTISVSAPTSPVATAPPPVPPVVRTTPSVNLASGVGGGPAEPAAPVERAPEPRVAAPSGPVGGWLSVQSPIEVDIFREGELVGTSRSARLMLPEGRHSLELVNTEVGFRQSIVASIAPGRESTVPVTLPNGVLHVNAVPWAEIFIDGRAAGETPVGNLQVPLGSHEVVFRHPALGEHRRTVLITAGEPARISVDLRR